MQLRAVLLRTPDEVDGSKQFLLNDEQNMLFDPNHEQRVELCQINNGRMDGYIKGCPYTDPQNFTIVDRLFRPIAGGNAQRNMYLAMAVYVFRYNTIIPVGIF